MFHCKLLGACLLGLAVWIPPAGAADEPKKSEPVQKKISELRLKGMKVALADLEKGLLKQKDYNDRPDSPSWPTFIELTKKECGIVWETVKKDTVSVEEYEGYNDVMLAEIEHRYGQGIFEKLHKKAQAVDEVLKVERAIDEALLKADVAALEKLLAPEATRTEPSGAITTKSEWLEEIKEAVRTTGQRYLSIKREAHQVRVYGETAVVTGLVHIRSSGATSTGQLHTNRYLRVYVGRQGGWQLVAHQVTRVSSAP
jgi:ketosteroid isomerase-like protein